MNISLNPGNYRNLGHLLCQIEDAEYYKKQRCKNMNQFLLNLAQSAIERYGVSAMELYEGMKEAMKKHRDNNDEQPETT